MNYKFLPALLPLLFLLNGCADNSVVKPPVAEAKKVPSKKNPPKENAGQTPQAQANGNKRAPNAGTATYGIDNSPGNFNDQPTTQALKAQPMAPPVPQTPAITGTPGIAPPPVATSIPGPGITSPTPAVTPAPGVSTPTPAPEAVAPPPQPAPPPTMTPIVLEDASLPSGTSPAVVALLSESDRSRKSGDLDSAVVVMERALRIDSRNPTLTYKLAQLRLKQSKPQQAEELARKAALLAGGDLDLKRKSWLLIAQSRQMQQDIPGAKEAKAKAQSFFGH